MVQDLTETASFNLPIEHIGLREDRSLRLIEVKEAEEASKIRDVLLRTCRRRSGVFLCLLNGHVVASERHAASFFWGPFDPIILIPTLHFFVASILDAWLPIHRLLLEWELAKEPPSESADRRCAFNREVDVEGPTALNPEIGPFLLFISADLAWRVMSRRPAIYKRRT